MKDFRKFYVKVCEKERGNSLPKVKKYYKVTFTNCILLTIFLPYQNLLIWMDATDC